MPRRRCVGRARLRHDRLSHAVGDHLVEVITAEEGVSACCEHLEGALSELEDGDVKGPAAEIEDSDPVGARAS